MNGYICHCKYMLFYNSANMSAAKKGCFCMHFFENMAECVNFAVVKQ